MKVIIHQNQQVLRVISIDDNSTVSFQEQQLVKLLQDLGIRYPEEIIGWCEETLFPSLNAINWKKIFHHELIMASYSISGKFSLLSGIGYVENSPFLKINFKNTYPTWLMSSDVGGIHAKVLNSIDKDFFKIEDFSFFINTVAKQGQINNLFCYSEPQLLQRTEVDNLVFPKRSLQYLFRFVRQNYKPKWSFILLFNYIIYERRFPIGAFVKAIRFNSKRKLIFDLSSIKIRFKPEKKFNKSLDVIIPTLGRSESLYKILCDFKEQSVLPKRIIIVEQNPDPNSKTELDYLVKKQWPFEIVHHFTNQLGACHARNWALDKIENEWVFFSDDDIRIKKNFIEAAFENIASYGTKCSTFSCVNKFGGGISNEKINQSTVFGSGNSFVKSCFLKDLRFSIELEHGYGEDMDFGIQLRNAGVDVIHFPEPQIHHLKAPTGGFRTIFESEWKKSSLKVQPAPTVLWIKLKHFTKEQFLGYKTFYFISQIQKGNYNLFALERRWKRSLNYANKL
jgi:glycosyltransferase involved in cell wall biosynthesis